MEGGGIDVSPDLVQCMGDDSMNEPAESAGMRQIHVGINAEVFSAIVKGLAGYEVDSMGSLCAE